VRSTKAGLLKPRRIRRRFYAAVATKAQAKGAEQSLIAQAEILSEVEPYCDAVGETNEVNMQIRHAAQQ